MQSLSHLLKKTPCESRCLALSVALLAVLRGPDVATYDRRPTAPAEGFQVPFKGGPQMCMEGNQKESENPHQETPPQANPHNRKSLMDGAVSLTGFCVVWWILWVFRTPSRHRKDSSDFHGWFAHCYLHCVWLSNFSLSSGWCFKRVGNAPSKAQEEASLDRTRVLGQWGYLRKCAPCVAVAV